AHAGQIGQRNPVALSIRLRSTTRQWLVERAMRVQTATAISTKAPDRRQFPERPPERAQNRERSPHGWFHIRPTEARQRLQPRSAPTSPKRIIGLASLWVNSIEAQSAFRLSCNSIRGVRGRTSNLGCCSVEPASSRKLSVWCP